MWPAALYVARYVTSCAVSYMASYEVTYVANYVVRLSLASASHVARCCDHAIFNCQEAIRCPVDPTAQQYPPWTNPTCSHLLDHTRLIIPTWPYPPTITGAADAFTLCSECSGKTNVCDATTCATANQSAGLISEIMTSTHLIHTGDFACEHALFNDHLGAPSLLPSL
jgi:hypothetical protein